MYTLDTTEARKADNMGGMITDIGKYIGTFTQAVDLTAKTGTKGIAFTFKTKDGQKANLSIYTKKHDGEKIMGYQALMAIMTCLKLRSIEQAQGKALKYDQDKKKEIEIETTVFPDLANKPIGVLLETEEYLKKDNSIGKKMVLKGVFQAETELTASEILDKKTEPKQLVRMVASLRNRTLKPDSKVSHSTSAPANGFDDMDDDIPF